MPKRPKILLDCDPGIDDTILLCYLAVAVEPDDLGDYAVRPVRVELRGEHTRGTTLWDARAVPGTTERRGVKVLTGSDVTTFQERLLAAILSH